MIKESLMKSISNKLYDQETIVYGEELIDNYIDTSANTILLVSHELSLSGAPVVLLNLALALKKEGWQSLILSPEDGPLGAYAADNGIPAIYIPGLYYSGVVSEISKEFAAVIASTIVTAPIVRELEGTNKPVMWWIHESAAAYSKENVEAMPLKLPWRVDVYCGGTYAKRMLLERFPRYRAKTLMYYVKDSMRDDLSAETSFVTRGCRERVFACIGMIENRKGQDIFVEAIECLPDEVRLNCRFVLVGRVADQEIKEKIEKTHNKYPTQVELYDGLGRDEVMEIYKRIDYLVCSSRDDPMPVVAAESMSIGKPCICSVNTGTADIIERYRAGFTYENNDPCQLAQLIVKASQLPADEYRRLSANARAAYEKEYSEEVFNKNLDEIMKRLTSPVCSRIWRSLRSKV